MPHDKKGRLIEVGDVVKHPGYAPDNKTITKVSRVHWVYPGVETCNLFVEGFDVRVGRESVTAKDSELVLKADGSEPKEPA